MSKRADLLSSIAETIADYRKNDVVAPTPEHVDRWVNQFDKTVQLPMLREMDHVLKRTYFSRKEVKAFLIKLAKTEALTGKDPCAFWRDVHFLDIQGAGNSQTEMLALFDTILQKKCVFGINECGRENAVYMYLDDGIFTGNRIRRDLEGWVKDHAPAKAKVHIITIALHSGGQHYTKDKIEETAKTANKKIRFKWWRAIELEDRRFFTNSSDVLRPVAIPDDDAVQTYVANMKHKPCLRTAGQVGDNTIFSSDEGRQLLEQEFLKAGVRIRQMCQNLNEYQRPLGNSVLETLGFGSLIVTFRNCPNNAPLALWVDNPWYPLFPRTTNTQTDVRRMFENLLEGEGE